MNEVIRQLYSRKSVRAFTSQEIGKEEKEAILRAAAEAPTAGNQQLYTILDITDQTIKDRLVETCDHQPMIAQAKAGEWRYKAEPYVYASNIFGPESDKFGLANVSWLTGTAAWMYIAVTQYMLGIKPRYDGLEIDPCLTENMLPAKVTRMFRGVKYEITITKNNKVFVPFKKDKDIVEITI